jgi:nitrogen fixation protein FixH
MRFKCTINDRKGEITGWRGTLVGTVFFGLVAALVLSCAVLATAPCWGTGVVLYRAGQESAR